jgi:MraZ protein
MFFGTHTSKVDAKKRASVPAAFRNHILARSPDFKGVAVFPSLKADDPAYIGCNPDYLTTLDERIRKGDFDPDVADQIAGAIFPYVEMLAFDDGGRVVLSKEIRAHIGIEAEVAFVGKGAQTFEIWNPAVHAPRAAAQRAAVGPSALSIMFDRGRPDGGAV